MCSVGYPLPKFWGGSDSWPRLNNSDLPGDAPQQSPTASIIGVCDAPVQVFDGLTIDVVSFVLLVRSAMSDSVRGKGSLPRPLCVLVLLLLNLLGDAVYLF